YEPGQGRQEHDPQDLLDPHRTQRRPRVRFRGDGQVRAFVFLQRVGVAATLIVLSFPVTPPPIPPPSRGRVREGGLSQHSHLLLTIGVVILLGTLPSCASKTPPARVPMPSSEVIAGILQAGRQAAAQGQFERAINLFRRVQEAYPTAPERSVATVLLAQTLERKQDIASALTEYRRLVAEFPQSPQAVLARAKIADLERQLPVARPPGMQLLGTYVEPEGLASLDERELNRVRQSGTNTVVVGIARNRTSSAGRAKGAPLEQTAAGVYFK